MCCCGSALVVLVVYQKNQIMISFKQFKHGVAAAFIFMSMGSAMAQPPKIGVQLWSVKDDIRQDFEGVLAKLAGLGFQGVEFAGEFGRFADDPAGLRAFLDKTGLQCAGAHLHFDALAADKIGATTDFYRTLGCSKLIIAMDKRAATSQGAVEVARQLAELSARLAPLSMKIGYHNHAEEMAGANGHTPWDVIATGTPAAVILQQDVGWTTYAGKDPVALARRYPGRSLSMHFKAKFAKGTNGTPIVGQDKTDWAGLITAARSVGGTQWIILEQEEYPNGMGQLEAVAASMRGLQAVLAQLPVK
jgi:sugar phosphate isomerase/epimerase